MIQFNKYNSRYVSFNDNFIEQFYKPLINESIEYKRMSGYFSSSIIDTIYEEICNVELLNFKIKIICSPELSIDDQIAISEGYELKDIIEKSIVSTIENLKNVKLPHITDLIARGIVDIKFVTTRNGKGIFHAKEGIFIDENNQKLAFIGSNNETSAAVHQNFETYVIIKSNENSEVVKEMEFTFDEIWHNENRDIVQCDITPKISEAFKKNKKAMMVRERTEEYGRKSIFSEFDLYQYQKDAINHWIDNDYIGLLEMATGTGKTITAIACQESLQKKVNNLITFVVAPQLDLVEQWYQEFEGINIHALKCSSVEKNYKELLKIKLSQKSTIEKPTIIITTSTTFSLSAFQNILKIHLKDEALLICDEVHSFGAEKTRKMFSQLEKSFKFRLGVSATPFRKDEDESKELIEFFKDIIFKYTLKDAIDNNFLNKYNYIPIILSFNNNELIKYRETLTNKINDDLSHKAILKEVEKLTSTIANSNTGKVEKLKELLNKENLTNPKIIYCSPGNYNDGTNIMGKRHIDYVSKELGKHGCRLRRIFSEISSEDRQEILKQFKSKDIDTLLAIKCLDQGVNLKEVTHAYILSSTDSLTEFIQRRGRILRKSEGKPISVIYDLIMLPESIDDIYFNPVFEDAYLVDRELRRMKEYNYAAENREVNDKVINEIEEAYHYVLEELKHGQSNSKRYK
ncbi:DEAD/DEAH box helicase family protein [Macrococcus animalis]|uniref:DEAD/DEAH box helicase family protein n=1 Tax=Macrococcus animalis TaxID=3395467 RepID=UPI0039BE24EF